MPYVVCVCYLPPSESTRLNDPELFYSTLLEQVYSYQNDGRIYICGVFNSRAGDASEFIEGVDDLTPRDVIDHTSNVNGDLLVEFLEDSGLCLVNGRVGHSDFTHVSHRGKSVVDHVCVPYEQLPFVTDFHVHLMSDIVGALNCPGDTKIPDHSVLTWTVVGCNKKRESRANNSARTSLKYNTCNISESFLNDDNSFDQVVAAIDKIERDLELLHDANSAYSTFKELIFSEMDSKLPKRKVSVCHQNKTAKSLYKPYWSAELDLKWDAVCTRERNWLRYNGGSSEKRRLRALYVSERRHFEK